MKSYRPRLRSWLTIAAIVVAIVLALRGFRSLRSSDPHAALHDTIAVLRAHADSCRNDVDGGAAQLRAYGRRLDSMRRRVREMEALDRRGVPADSYAVYMDAFTMYNDSVAAWPLREDSLRARDARCRDIAETHNLLADSLRRLVFPASPPPD